MLKLPHSNQFAQRVARRFLVGFCAVLAVGVGGAVLARLIHPPTAHVRFIETSDLEQINVFDPGEYAAYDAADEAAETASLVQRAEAPVKPVPAPVKSSVPTKSPVPIPAALLAASAPDREITPRTRTILMEVTAYCECAKCCGTHSPGITASGKKVTYNRGRFVAADTRLLPFGTMVSIPGYHDGMFVPVLDRGGAIKGNKLDLYFPSHQAALQWGRQKVMVTVAID